MNRNNAGAIGAAVFACALALVPMGAMATDARIADFAQAGKIRVALFLPQHAKDSTTGQLRGIGTGAVAIDIARALATRPNYMLLDEPFAGIDPIAVGDIQDLVRHLTNRGIGVLITDHNVRETLGLTDRAYIVYAGEILTEGSPDEIVRDPDVRRLYLGEEFRL